MSKESFLLGLIILYSALSHGVVMRHDIPNENYKVSTAPAYIIDMPHEGHGVLIKPQWIVSSAHLIFYDYAGKSIEIGSKSYVIEEVIIHPEYEKPDKSLFSGDAKPLMNFLKGRSDIVLIKLSEPVSKKIKPISIYGGQAEKGKVITVFGRGAIGDGISGEELESKSKRSMNSFTNTIEAVDGNWLTYSFNAPPNALALEGMHGSGDSGGAAIVLIEGSPVLVGLSSWQYWHGNIEKFKGGLYGTTAYQVRLSSYKNWIYSVINGSN